MSEEKMMGNEPANILLSEIGEQYGQLRIIKPASDTSMLKSMEKYGQLSPVVVCRGQNNKYELLDGFKRLRASRKLNKKFLKASFLDIGVHASKAAIIQLNWAGKSISNLEEAMVVRSLYSENGLTQVEIGTLLNRHKSWVCRRISLIEKLCDEAKESVKLGLIKVSIALELTKLRRCNQEAALLAIQKHSLTSREAEKLIFQLLSRPSYEHEAIRRCPEKIIHQQSYDKQDHRLSQAGSILKKKLMSMQECCLWVAKEVNAKSLSHLTEGDFLCLSPLIGSSIRLAQQVCESLRKVLSV